MDNQSGPPVADRAPRAVFRPDPRLTALTAVLAAIAAALAAVSSDRSGAVLLVLAALVLACYAAADLLWRPRLSVDAAGLRVRGPGSSAVLAWTDVQAVRADVRMRHGLRSVALEIDAGDRLVVLSRRVLGTDPEQAAEIVRAFDPRS
ncbi:MAG TPA: PH domain-containing protein [Jatrophihabitantaceae bacterium]|nr:PH domain-containing protein [Jatrophihabitantaceae bacterium]